MAQTSDFLFLRYLERAKDPSYVRRQDFFTVVSYISRNPAGTNLAWDFYR
jgi:glutamyl aminopeptidase